MSVLTAKHLLTVDHDVIATLPPGSRLFMPDVPREEYEYLLSQLEDNNRFRLSYDQGKLEIVTLSPRHENIKVLFAHILLVLVEALDLKMIGLGSTTFTMPEAVKGTEPDDCFYLRRAELIEGKEVIDLSVDPGPDLVISDLFPFLSSETLTEFLQQGKFRDILQMVKAFRLWASSNIPQ